MKKIFMFSVALLTLLVFNNNVNAACGSGAYVDGEMVCLVTGSTGGNSKGTAYAESNTLVLDNYNGGSIRFYSGIGDPSEVEIKLVGNNYITSEDSYGILSFNGGINFIGDGTLTIKSKMPFLTNNNSQEPSYLSHLLENNKVSTIKIVVGKSDEENKTSDNKDVEIKDETINNNEEVKENNNLIIIVLIVCLCVSFISIVAVINNNNKIKKLNN